MAEEKKGHVKMTFEMEINEALMDLLKENMKNLPQMMQMWQMRREERTKSA
jgi:hypothetical protein